MISTAYADDFRLFIEGTDFNILSGYELNQIKKITFEEGQVVITKQDGNRNATAFSDINRIHFSTDPLPLAVEEVKTEGDEYDLDILVKTIKGVLTDDSYSIILPKIPMFAPKDCIIKINAADIDKIISYIQTMPMA